MIVRNELVLIHAPYGRDAEMIRQVLERAGMQAEVCTTVDTVAEKVGDDTGAALISDEALTAANVEVLSRVLQRQPPWSDLPILITTSGGDATEASRKRLHIVGPLGNVSLLERPLRTVTLVSAIQTSLRARRRQYQLRDHVLERERLLKELERSNKELTDFAHIVSHDVQAPVRVVKSFSQLLARNYGKSLDATADEYISHIQNAASTMEDLVQTLLHYATLGQQPLAAQLTDMSTVVNTVLITLKPAVDEIGAQVRVGELPAINGDRVLLQQLIQNLVANALKYRNGDESPRVDIHAEQKNERWLFSIRDNGPGIPPEYHERIFAPLKRLHGRDVPGTGMGLTVCRRIVERHGGQIWVESEPNRGATFYFTLA